MAPKKKEEEPKKAMLIGRPGNNVKVGIVGMPNVGKSTTFNIMCNMSVAAENFPFCTIDPSEARVEVPDPAFKNMVGKFKPKNEVPAFLQVCDIAGLVKGASEGEGLGNAFLSHINATGALRQIFKEATAAAPEPLTAAGAQRVAVCRPCWQCRSARAFAALYALRTARVQTNRPHRWRRGPAREWRGADTAARLPPRSQTPSSTCAACSTRRWTATRARTSRARCAHTEYACPHNQPASTHALGTRGRRRAGGAQRDKARSSPARGHGRACGPFLFHGPIPFSQFHFVGARVTGPGNGRSLSDGARGC